MKGRLCCFVVAMQIVISLVSATIGYFPKHHHDHDHDQVVNQPGPSESPLSSQFSMESKQEFNEEAYYYRGFGTIGSSPPSCDHKCYGYFPCVAIQVPTITSHPSVQYTNYEPEGWKCRCGPSLYSP